MDGFRVLLRAMGRPLGKRLRLAGRRRGAGDRLERAGTFLGRSAFRFANILLSEAGAISLEVLSSGQQAVWLAQEF